MGFILGILVSDAVPRLLGAAMPSSIYRSAGSQLRSADVAVLAMFDKIGLVTLLR